VVRTLRELLLSDKTEMKRMATKLREENAALQEMLKALSSSPAGAKNFHQVGSFRCSV
jgi:hypothetical protein